MIYHHFGGKDRLYVAVQEHVLGELRAEKLKLDFEHVSPVDGDDGAFRPHLRAFRQAPRADQRAIMNVNVFARLADVALFRAVASSNCMTFSWASAEAAARTMDLIVVLASP